MQGIPERAPETGHLAPFQQREPAHLASTPHVVIVGAGFGGLQAARALQETPVRVTIIDCRNHHLFQPLLYQVATAVLSPADICAPIRHVFKRQKNVEVLLAEVTGVDVQGQRVLLGETSLAYDFLILATGACDSYFGHDDWAQFAPGLKSIEQARVIRRTILLAFEAAEQEKDLEKRQALLTFVLVGAGATGVEMAGALSGLVRKTLPADFRHINTKEARILLAEALPKILAPFPESLAKKAYKVLKRQGVEIRTNAPVESIDCEGVVLAGERIRAHTVIWTAGVKASPAGEWLGAETDRAGRVKVLPDLTVPGHDTIFVIGDTASMSQEGKPLPGVAQVAIQQGRYAASVIADRASGKKHPQIFHYREKGSLATIKLYYSIGVIGKWRFAGLLGWLVWLMVHLLSLIGYRNRLVVLFQWAVYCLTFQRGARLITCEETATREKPSYQGKRIVSPPTP